MTTTQRTGLQAELSNYLLEDVIVFIKRRRNEDHLTYAQIAAELSESGYTVRAKTVESWLSYERRRR